ncbi:aromatic ring-hydroxylating dioxygenase subunit alpha [Alphaproteobacteria bacterium]|nr:aromatic ring-hydroxylating dioxygenase subunit alpha [Alphaproteobacteria bacterium]
MTEKTGFLHNGWYAAGWQHEIGREILLARIILDEPVVLYRRQDGTPVALEDRCCHRSVPLSVGKLMGDNLQCGYHGLIFDATGDCINVPGQVTVPPGASVRSYPTVDRHNLVWIWMGDADHADAAAIPYLHWLDAPGWVAKPGYLCVECSYRLIIDNLLDTSHLTFVHAGTIGTSSNAETPAQTDRGDNEVVVTRWMMDIEPSPTWRRLGFFDGNIDRCQINHWMVPTAVTVDATKWAAGEGGPDADRNQAFEVFNISAITPETATTSHYFWSQALGPRVNADPALNEMFHDQIYEAFLEDQALLELQQSRINQYGRADNEIDINADNGVLQARRILDRLIAAENYNP